MLKPHEHSVTVDRGGPQALVSAAMILPWCQVLLAWKPWSTAALNSAWVTVSRQEDTLTSNQQLHELIETVSQSSTGDLEQDALVQP